MDQSGWTSYQSQTNASAKNSTDASANYNYNYQGTQQQQQQYSDSDTKSYRPNIYVPPSTTDVQLNNEHNPVGIEPTISQRTIMRECKSMAVTNGGVPGALAGAGIVYALSHTRHAQTIKTNNVFSYLISGFVGYAFGYVTTYYKCFSTRAREFVRLQQQKQQSAQSSDQWGAQQVQEQFDTNPPSTDALHGYDALRARNRLSPPSPTTTGHHFSTSSLNNDQSENVRRMSFYQLRQKKNVESLNVSDVESDRLHRF